MSTTLLVLIPLLVLPVVALLAFAGCAAFGTDTTEHTGTAAGPPLVVEPETPPPPARPSYPDTILNGGEGLVAYWRLSDAAGTLVAVDQAPLHLNGTYTGTPAVSVGQAGGASTPRQSDTCAGFPGDGGHVQVDFSANLNPAPMLQFSFEVWARLRNPAARAGTDEFLASSRSVGAAQVSAGWELYVSYGPGGEPTFRARLFNGNGATSTRADALAQSGSAAADAWHHVVLTYDGTGGGTLAVYVRIVGDPTVFPKVVTPAPYQPNVSAPLRIGAGNGPFAYDFFEGDLDEAAFYNRALTAPQVEAHFKAALAGS